MPAPRADALIEGAQRARRSDGAPGGLDEGVPAGRRAVLGDAPVLGGRVTGLANARVQAQVADELGLREEPADVADCRQERRGRDVDARDDHQPADLWPL